MPSDNGVLQSHLIKLSHPSQVPTNHSVQVAVRDGLGITSRSERELFELDRDGGLLDKNSFLRDRMPQLFTYLAKNDPWILTTDRSTWTDGDRIWPYVLLARDKRSLVPAVLNGHVDPTISDFRDNSGRKTCPDSERVVFIGEIFLALQGSHASSLTALNYSHSCEGCLQDNWQVDTRWCVDLSTGMLLMIPNL